MKVDLFPVPEDASQPCPVDFVRVGAIVESFGAKLEVHDSKNATAHFDAVPFSFSFTNDQQFLSIRTEWITQLADPHEVLSVLFPLSDSWNRERYFPTVYSLIEGDSVLVVCDFIIEISRGKTDDQLMDVISAGVATCVDARQYMQNVVARLREGALS